MKLLLITLAAFVAVASARYYDLSQLDQISSRVEVVPENVRCFRQEVRNLRQRYPEHDEWFGLANNALIKISKEARKCQGNPECLAEVRESAKEEWGRVEDKLNETEGGRVILAELEAAAKRCNLATPKFIDATAEIEPTPEYVACFRQKLRQIRDDFPQHDDWFAEANRALIDISRAIRNCTGDAECLAKVEEEAKDTWAALENELVAAGGQEVLDRLKQAYADCTKEPALAMVLISDETDSTEDRRTCIQEAVKRVEEENPDFHDWFEELHFAHNEARRRADMCESRDDKECWDAVREFAKAEWDVLKYQLEHREGGSEVLAALESAIRKCFGPAPEETLPETQPEVMSYLYVDEPQDERLNCIREELHRVTEEHPDFNDWFEELRVAHNEARRRAEMCESRDDKECWDAVHEFAQAEWEVLKSQLEHREGGSEVLAALQSAVRKCHGPAPEASLLTMRDVTPSSVQCILRELQRIRQENANYDDWFAQLQAFLVEAVARARRCDQGDKECYENVNNWANTELEKLRQDLASRPGGDAVLKEVDDSIKDCIFQGFAF